MQKENDFDVEWDREKQRRTQAEETARGKMPISFNARAEGERRMANIKMMGLGKNESVATLSQRCFNSDSWATGEASIG